MPAGIDIAALPDDPSDAAYARAAEVLAGGAPGRRAGGSGSGVPRGIANGGDGHRNDDRSDSDGESDGDDGEAAGGRGGGGGGGGGGGAAAGPGQVPHVWPGHGVLGMAALTALVMGGAGTVRVRSASRCFTGLMCLFAPRHRL